jgi:VWFA-related protein
MQPRLKVALASALIVTGTGLFAGQQAPNAPPAQPGRFTAASAGVLVDVVVRDKKGPVTDLNAEDFAITEDGKPQEVVSFERHMVADTASAGGTTTVSGAAPATPAKSTPAIVALAYDRLTPEGRSAAYKASQAFLKSRRPDELTGVFVVDQAMRTMTTYTTNPQKLEAAIEQAAQAATTQTGKDGGGLAARAGVGSPGPAVAGAESAGNPPGVGGGGAAPTANGAATDQAAMGSAGQQAAIVAAVTRMDQSYSDLLMQVQGHASIDALLALVDSLGTLPGRKAVLYFCEGLVIPPAVEPRFRSVIAAANRRNVAIYALDAAGLRVHGQQEQAYNQLDAITKATTLGVDRDPNTKYTEGLELNETMLRSNPEAGLTILASQTGGVLIQNTNALEKGVERIDEDRRNYYMLGYVSTNPALDGTFRKIEVKVKRPGLEARARPGYLAVPADMGAPVLTYEAPAIAAMTASPRPTAFPIQSRAFAVPMPGHAGLTAVMIGVGASSLTFTEDAKTGTYAGDAVVLASLSGPAMRKQSQEYKMTGKLDQLAQVKSGGLLFFRTPELQPGKYDVTSVVYDVKGSKASVAASTVTVPAAESVMVGDLFLVSRFEKVSASDPGMATHPLVSNNLLLYPSFGEPISKAKHQELDLALPLVLPTGGQAPTATLQILQNGQKLAEIPMPLDKPGADGRLLQLTRLPSAAIPAGNYDFKVSLFVGGNKVERTVALALVD